MTERKEMNMEKYVEELRKAGIYICVMTLRENVRLLKKVLGMEGD